MTSVARLVRLTSRSWHLTADRRRYARPGRIMGLVSGERKPAKILALRQRKGT